MEALAAYPRFCIPGGRDKCSKKGKRGERGEFLWAKEPTNMPQGPQKGKDAVFLPQANE